MKVVYVGDLHGQVEYLDDMVRTQHCDELVVAGDFGIGFDNKLDSKFIQLAQEIANEELPTKRVKFIRGNHDNPNVLKDWNRMVGPGLGIEFIPDFHIDYETLFVGGGRSWDQQYREPGRNWWADEEISQEAWDEFFGKLKSDTLLSYGITRVVSHDVPHTCGQYLQGLSHKPFEVCRTTRNLTTLSNFLPNVTSWIHGHYHVHRNYKVGNTLFHSLAPSHNDPLTSVVINYNTNTYYLNQDC